MKTKKEFDCVKMMRDIRDNVSVDIQKMSPEQILDYIKKGHNDYQKIIASHQSDKPATLRSR